jgi:hypothetical protein
MTGGFDTDFPIIGGGMNGVGIVRDTVGRGLIGPRPGVRSYNVACVGRRVDRRAV